MTVDVTNGGINISLVQSDIQTHLWSASGGEKYLIKLSIKFEYLLVQLARNIYFTESESFKAHVPPTIHRTQTSLPWILLTKQTSDFRGCPLTHLQWDLTQLFAFPLTRTIPWQRELQKYCLTTHFLICVQIRGHMKMSQRSGDILKDHKYKSGKWLESVCQKFCVRAS